MTPKRIDVEELVLEYSSLSGVKEIIELSDAVLDFVNGCVLVGTIVKGNLMDIQVIPTKQICRMTYVWRRTGW